MIYYLRELQRDNRLIEKKAEKPFARNYLALPLLNIRHHEQELVGLGLASLSILQRNCEYFNLHISSFLWRPVS